MTIHKRLSNEQLTVPNIIKSQATRIELKAQSINCLPDNKVLNTTGWTCPTEWRFCNNGIICSSRPIGMGTVARAYFPGVNTVETFGHCGPSKRPNHCSLRSFAKVSTGQNLQLTTVIKSRSSKSNSPTLDIDILISPISIGFCELAKHLKPNKGHKTSNTWCRSWIQASHYIESRRELGSRIMWPMSSAHYWAQAEFLIPRNRINPLTLFV